MFLVGVTEGKKVGKYEVDCSDEANVLKKRDKDGNPVQARGMGAALFAKLAKQLHDDFRKLHPRGHLGIWMDLAQAHKGARAELQKLFKLGVIEQPPRSPDFNLLDAGVFPYMERRQQQEGAMTFDEIRAGVDAAYAALSDEVVTKVCNAVRANFKVALKKMVAIGTSNTGTKIGCGRRSAAGAMPHTPVMASRRSICVTIEGACGVCTNGASRAANGLVINFTAISTSPKHSE